MTLHTRRPRAAFTLVELLVVIAIIAVLVGLLMAAVQRVRVMGPQTENASRIQQIHDAVGRCKGDLKLDYIPSGSFQLKSSYATNDPELEILLQAFPNLNTSATGLPNVTLDANQTLCFFLTGGVVTNFTGFSNNPRQPFTPGGAAEVRKGPWIQGPVNKLFKTAPNGHAWIIDVHGVPYAYFASVKGKPNNYGTQTFTLPNGPWTGSDYPLGNPAPGPITYWTNGGKVVNESGFQIISAGTDKKFGAGGALPATGTPGGADDQSNFTKNQLSGGIN
jgi:prepilin-type N-terminal cleavage/methylation domain-containing protein